jgi:hypothetical protein
MRTPAGSFVASCLLCSAACFGGYATGGTPGAPAAPTSDSEEGRRALAERSAMRELACDEVRIVATIDRRYANAASVRYVIEGCGHRALYVEDCSRESSCRYLLVSVVPVAPAGSAAPSGR